MLKLWPTSMAVYLHKAPVDFRKQINGLSVIVAESMAMDPFKPALFVFANRARDRVKVLYCHVNGFCLWQKRLEKTRIVWPTKSEDETITLSGDQLNWLVAGYDVFRFAPNELATYSAVT